MKNLFRNIFLVSCLLLTVGAVEAQAQTVQKQIDPSLQTQMAELKAKMQKLEPNSSSYKATKAEYDRLLSKESESQKAEAPQVAKPATIAPQKTAMPPVKVDGKLAKGTAKAPKANELKSAKPKNYDKAEEIALINNKIEQVQAKLNRTTDATKKAKAEQIIRSLEQSKSKFNH